MTLAIDRGEQHRSCCPPSPGDMQTSPSPAEPAARKPAILTHGFGDSGDAWRWQREGLRADLDIVTWDLPGHGARPSLAGLNWDIDMLTAELREMVRAAPSPPLLIGHSVGGYLSLRCALTSPEPLLGLVLISAGPGFRSASRMTDWNRRIDYVTGRLRMPEQAGRSIYMKDSLVIEGLDALTMPTLVIMGTDDRPLYHEGCRYVADHVPCASLVVVQDAHHNPHQTHPAEVNRAISAFARQLNLGGQASPC